MRWGLAGLKSITVPLSLILCSAAVAADCSELRLLASLPITTHPTGRVTVPATIQDREKHLMIDTGGFVSMLSENAVAETGLRPKIMQGPGVRMFGGREINEYVFAPLKLGSLSGAKVYFFVMPNDFVEGGMAGILGGDILHQFDIELDFKSGKFNVFEHNQCERAPVYWTQGTFAAVPMRRAADRSYHVSVTVYLDGRRLEAWLDTGAAGSVLNLQAARRLFGWTASGGMPDMEETYDGGYRFPFKLLSFEGVEVRNPDITLYSDLTMKFPGRIPLILGMSVLRQAHLYIAYKDQTLYITPASAN